MRSLRTESSSDMGDSSHAERIKTLLTCPICLGLLNQPMRIKECFHAICRSCFLKETKNVRVYTCPSCDVTVNAIKPWLDIGSDKSLEEVINAIVNREMETSEDESEEAENIPITPENEEPKFAAEYKELICLRLCSYGGAVSDKQRLIERPFYQVDMDMLSGVLCKFVRRRLGINDDSRLELRAVRKNGRVGPIVADHVSIRDLCRTYEWDQSSPLRIYFDLKDERLLAHKISVGGSAETQKTQPIATSTECPNDDKPKLGAGYLAFPFGMNTWMSAPAQPYTSSNVQSAFQRFVPRAGIPPPAQPFRFPVPPPNNRFMWPQPFLQQFAAAQTYYRMNPLFNQHFQNVQTPQQLPAQLHELMPKVRVAQAMKKAKNGPKTNLTTVSGGAKKASDMFAITPIILTINSNKNIEDDVCKVVNSILEQLAENE